MKKWIAMLLAVSLAVTLAVPALAVEQEEEEQPELISAPAEDFEQTEYDRGWDAGYEVGEAEGIARGEAAFQAGAPYREPEVQFTEGDTYEAGYADGYSWGMQNGYHTGYCEEYDRGWDVGYDETYQKGLEAGMDDARAGTPVQPAARESREDGFTYENGLADGRIDGFESGYYEGYVEVSGRYLGTDLSIAEKGGVPGQINVLWKGECVKFDVAPQVRDQRTMVPVRAVMETMGADVAYDETSKTVSIQMGDVLVKFVLGSDAFTIVKNGVTEVRQMDTAPYAENSRTMVPVRFLAEASGYTVLWDQDYKTVVILDEAAKIAEIDSKFTEINSILDARVKDQLGKKYQDTVNLKGSFTVYDEAGKATVCPFSGKATAYTDGVAARVDLSLDIRDALMELVKSGSDLGDTQVSLRTILTTDWSDLTLSILMDQEGKLYLNFPLLAALSPEIYNGKDGSAWLMLGDLSSLAVLSSGGAAAGMVPMGEIPVFNLAELQKEGFTIGKLLMMTGVQTASPFEGEEALDMAVSILEAIFGDSRVQKTGDRCTWTTDLDSLFGALSGNLEQEDLDELKQMMDLDMTFSADPRGAYDLDLGLNIKAEELFQLSCSLKASGTAKGGTLTLKAAMDGAFVLDLNVTQTNTEVNSLPSLTLPEGAQVVDLMGAEVE